MASKPGIIAVHSCASSPLVPPRVFQKRYQDIQIPYVLGTGHVKSGATYDTIYDHAYPFLAIYQLPNMNWLHEYDCQFWKIPIHSTFLSNGNPSIFAIADFKTEFFEMIDTVQLGKAAADRDGSFASRLLLSPFNLRR